MLFGSIQVALDNDVMFFKDISCLAIEQNKTITKPVKYDICRVLKLH